MLFTEVQEESGRVECELDAGQAVRVKTLEVGPGRGPGSPWSVTDACRYGVGWK